MVAENVHKKTSVRFQPPGYPVKDTGVVTQMLKHLDRHNAIKTLVYREMVDVRGNDPHVAKTQFGGALLDKQSL